MFMPRKALFISLCSYYKLSSQCTTRAELKKVIFMDTKTRILICRVLERMHTQEDYSRRLELEDSSDYLPHENMAGNSENKNHPSDR